MFSIFSRWVWLKETAVLFSRTRNKLKVKQVQRMKRQKTWTETWGFICRELRWFRLSSTLCLSLRFLQVITCRKGDVVGRLLRVSRIKVWEEFSLFSGWTRSNFSTLEWDGWSGHTTWRREAKPNSQLEPAKGPESTGRNVVNVNKVWWLSRSRLAARDGAEPAAGPSWCHQNPSGLTEQPSHLLCSASIINYRT